MLKYAPEDILSGPYLVEYYRPELIKDFLSHLRPNNFRLMLVTDSYPNEEWKRAAHYGTEYIQMPLPKEIVDVLLCLTFLLIFP
jgi:insulysin